MHRTRIDLTAKTRARMTSLLNARLADAIDLQLQAKQAHWNVKVAIAMKKADLTLTQATARLKKSHDSIREALGEDLEPHLRKLLAKL